MALRELAVGLKGLSKRGQVTLFVSCSTALLPAYREWASHFGRNNEELLIRALRTAEAYAIGTLTKPVSGLLGEVEAATPEGESPDAFSPTFAQDCWICADVALRIYADPEYDAGRALEYALEPVVTRASQELFGVSQIGSGELEDAQTRQMMEHPAVTAGLGFLRWAIKYLSLHENPEHDDLALVQSRAGVLM